MECYEIKYQKLVLSKPSARCPPNHIHFWLIYSIAIPRQTDLNQFENHIKINKLDDLAGKKQLIYCERRLQQ